VGPSNGFNLYSSRNLIPLALAKLPQVWPIAAIWNLVQLFGSPDGVAEGLTNIDLSGDLLRVCVWVCVTVWVRVIGTPVLLKLETVDVIPGAHCRTVEFILPLRDVGERTFTHPGGLN